MDYTKKHLAAVESLVYKYEKAIVDLENGDADLEKIRRRWENYGLRDHCALCKTTTSTIKFFGDCRKCVLGPGEDGCVTSSFGQVIKWVRQGIHPVSLVHTLRVRLNWLLKKIDRNGIEVK